MKNNGLLLKMFSKLFGFATLFIMVAACQQEDNISTGEATDKVVITPTMLKFAEAPFSEDDGAVTRGAAEAPQTKSVDLGNGIEAQMTLEADAKSDTIFKKPRTRASQPLSNGFYTIRAFQGNTLKGEMKGYINSGVFTPATGSKDCIILDPNQNYDFVCFNDKLSLNSDGTLSVTQANVKTAYIGRLDNTYVTGKTQYISFYMKHVGSRVFLELHSFLPIKHAVSATLTSPNNNVPTSVKLDEKGNNPIATSVTTINETLTADYRQQYTGIPPTDILYHTSEDPKNDMEWHYNNRDTTYTWFLPGTPLRQMRLALPSLTLYGKTVAPSTHLYSTDPALFGFVTKENTTYKLKIRLVYTGFKYLFSDGTVGTLKANRTKTPIAFVVKDNDGTPNSGVAIALKEADLGSTWSPSGNVKNTDCQWTTQSLSSAPYSSNPVYMTTNFQRLGTGLTDNVSDMNGYNWTWDPATNAMPNYSSGQPKGNNQWGFPAFYYAAHYDPGVTLTGTIANQKWYLPASGEWRIAMDAMSLGQINNDWSYNGGKGAAGGGRFDPVIVNYALTAHYSNNGILVGGQKIEKQNAFTHYFTSSFVNSAGMVGPDELDISLSTGWTGNDGTSYPSIYSIGIDGSGQWNQVIDLRARVRAFIHF
jgi:hypothetical protein